MEQSGLIPSWVKPMTAKLVFTAFNRQAVTTQTIGRIFVTSRNNFENFLRLC